MAQTAQLRRIEHPDNEAQRIFQLQREAYLQHPFPSLEERCARLRAVERILVENRDAIAEAIHRDFGHRCTEESLMLEVFTCVDGIRHTLKKLPRWMRPQRRSVSILFATGRNRLLPQPKGVVGIVSPWNYPLFLTVSPLTSALAAGNRAMIKMASHSQRLCRLLQEKFGAAIAEDVVAILPGIPARDFSTLPFDHLIFTGSADAGRTVMRDAAENLTPVTLELGGKSPTILCDDFDVDEAASRILYAKLVNAGQTCLAPDYLFLPEAARERFVAAARRIVPQRYPDTKDSSYTSIIDEKSYRRLRATLKDAEEKGASVIPLVPGASFDDSLRKVPPHLVLGVTDDMTIMKEEIFGPLLPVKTYRDLDEVIAYINSKDRPLGFYVFTNDKKREEKLLYATISGGVSINNCMFHVAQHDLPFGGVGASGMGQYHSFEGFVEFSKMRPVFTNPRLSLLHLFYPPYGPRHRRVLDALLRWAR
ncbi:MAG TPA: coniferyl-aldehyde dehydrogenase [Deltaproteobacteria bacterium]|jgi:coniferyl-aldehyde dehydrogenase|nr:coniferyl-aldehyde dehydrogenase [Deltaproteobacteria bacterium]